jgi:hypothetical protein
MTTFLIVLAVLVVIDAVALAKGVRTDRSTRPPRSTGDWGSPSLPTGPYATR